jgi:hypothetical protein|tara:strand:- start:932 stop:1039 length:108 start_codon:yes stop_codon:yes gene_type:complete
MKDNSKTIKIAFVLTIILIVVLVILLLKIDAALLI